MTREEELFQKRLLDLADTAWRRNIVTYTDFLNLNEQNIYHDSLQKLSFIQSESFGGYESAERQMVAFIPDALSRDRGYFSQASFPIACLKIRPLNVKFSDKLTHRDYLGSLMNLGIDRSRTGDIVIQDQDAWLFCQKKIADYVAGELTRVRHTAVSCLVCSPQEVHYQPSLQELTGTVASVRLDSLLSLAFQTSRSSITALIQGGKTFANGRLVTSNGYHVKEGDIISVRGLGRFRYDGVLSATKKGRCLVRIQKYV